MKGPNKLQHKKNMLIYKTETRRGLVTCKVTEISTNTATALKI